MHVNKFLQDVASYISCRKSYILKFLFYITVVQKLYSLTAVLMYS